MTDKNKLQFLLSFVCQVKRVVMGPVCWLGVWERNSRVLLIVHLSKQLIKPEITHREQHGRRAEAWARDWEQSNTQLRTGNKQTSPQTQWGDSGSCCSDCTAEQEEETSHQTQARKQSEGSFRSWSREVGQRWEERGGGRQQQGQTEGGAVRGLKQSKIDLYLLPLPLSRNNSYLRWSQSWLSFRCWPRSPGGVSSARSAHRTNLTTPPYHPASDQHA